MTIEGKIKTTKKTKRFLKRNWKQAEKYTKWLKVQSYAEKLTERDIKLQKDFSWVVGDFNMYVPFAKQTKNVKNWQI